jgi:hypothetical protein
MHITNHMQKYVPLFLYTLFFLGAATQCIRRAAAVRGVGGMTSCCCAAAAIAAGPAAECVFAYMRTYVCKHAYMSVCVHPFTAASLFLCMYVYMPADSPFN